METPQQIINVLTFVTQILKEDILPAVETLGSASSVDISPILASLLTIENSIGSLDTLVTDSFNNIPKSLFLEYVVSADCTSVDLGELFDINTHKSYRVQIEYKNSSSSNSDLYLYFNNDFSNSNYVSHSVLFTSVASYRNNLIYPICASCYAGGISFVNFNLTFIDGKPFISGQSVEKTSSYPIYTRIFSSLYNLFVSDFFSVALVASVANSIKAGSVIRVYRGDV